MDLIAPKIKLEELSPCVLPAVMELSSDREWRVRIGVLEQSTHLAKSLGHELFIEELMSVVLKWLCDPVFKVREAAAAVLSDLAVELGPEATVEHILPQLSDLARNSNYLYRMTTLMGCVSLSQSLSPALVGDKILPVVKQLVNDSVPNVRFNVAKALKAIAVRLPRRAEAVGAPLRTLMADADKDVRFFAKEAIVNLDSS
jgi:serine/threonine-protein phosphatase 2A regulatory subunit A